MFPATQIKTGEREQFNSDVFDNMIEMRSFLQSLDETVVFFRVAKMLIQMR
jgi:hypothetical protein